MTTTGSSMCVDGLRRLLPAFVCEGYIPRRGSGRYDVMGTKPDEEPCATPSRGQRTIREDLAPIKLALRLAAAHFPGLCIGCAGDGSTAELSPEESRLVAGATVLRRHEFASGRKAARSALLEAGAGQSIIIGCDAAGVPIFPSHYVGSIAHSHGRAVAVSGRGREFEGVGVDLEYDGIDDGLAETVLTTTERQALLPALKLCVPALRSPTTLIFSAKEAIYKAVFPTYRTVFDASDIELSVVPERLLLRTTREVPGGPSGPVEVRYEVRQRWIVTLVALARR